MSESNSYARILISAYHACTLQHKTKTLFKVSYKPLIQHLPKCSTRRSWSAHLEEIFTKAPVQIGLFVSTEQRALSHHFLWGSGQCLSIPDMLELRAHLLSVLTDLRMFLWWQHNQTFDATVRCSPFHVLKYACVDLMLKQTGFASDTKKHSQGKNKNPEKNCMLSDMIKLPTFSQMFLLTFLGYKMNSSGAK